MGFIHERTEREKAWYMNGNDPTCLNLYQAVRNLADIVGDHLARSIAVWEKMGKDGRLRGEALKSILALRINQMSTRLAYYAKEGKIKWGE